MRCLLDKATARFAVQGLLKPGEGQTLGAEEVLMINNWRAQQMEIHARLAAMHRDLHAPYGKATLPRVLRPEEIVVT
jgi:hypothetical protein